MAKSFFDLASDTPSRSIPEVQAVAATRNQGGERVRLKRDNAERRQAAEVKENTGFGELIGATMVHGTPGYIDRLMQESEVRTPGAEYKLPDDFVDQMHKHGIGTDQWEIFSRATNDEHFSLLTGFAMTNEDVKRTQAQFGLVGNIAASAFDPGAAALDATTGGLAVSSRVGRLANAVRGGLAASATNTALSVASSTYNPEVDGTDHAIAAATGFVMGGVFSAHRGADFVPPSKVREVAERDFTGRASRESLSAAKVEGIPDNQTPGLSQRTVSDALEEHRGTDADEIGIRPAFAPIRRSLSARMGNMKSPAVRKASRWLYRDGVGYTDRDAVIRESAGQKAARDRATLETKVMRSWDAAWNEHRRATGVARYDEGERLKFSRQVAEVLRGAETDNAAVNQSAQGLRGVLDELHDLRVRAGLAEPGDKAVDYFPQIQSAQSLSKVYGEMGLSERQVEDIYTESILSRMRTDADGEARAKFDEIEAGYQGTSDAALRARERSEDLGRAIGDRQQRLRDAEARVAEVADVPGAHGERLRTAAKRRYEDAVRKLDRANERLTSANGKLKAALEAEAKSKHAAKHARAVADDGGIDEELARAYARALVARGKQKVLGVTDTPLKPLDLDDLEELRNVLTEAGASEARITSILGKYSARAEEAGKVGSSKKRIRLDSGFRTTVTNRFGDQVEIGVTDFMENDALRVVTSYARDTIGWSAISSHGNIRGPGELRGLKRMLLDDARNAGDDTEAVERMFDIGVNSIMGRSTETNPNSKWSKMGRAMRDVQFVRLMNQVGFTLFTELGPTVARAGVLNTAKSIFYVGDFLKRGRDGTLKGKEARWLEDLIGTGTEFLRNPVFMRLEDDAFMPSAYGNSRVGRGIENVSNRAQRLSSILSGMAPMNTALQRLAGRATLMRLLEMANSTKPLKTGEIRRMRSYGLDQADQEALFASLKGVKKVDDITEHALSHEQRERVAAYMYAVTRHAVLEGEASDSIVLMHSAAGKLLTQFRSFMAYSYERHFLNSAYHWKDWNTYMMVSLSTTIAGLQWAARSYLNNVHDEKKRKELLTWGNFAENAVGQSSWGGIVPALVDTAAPFLGQDPVFSNSRSTGLSNNLIGGIPSVDWANRVLEAATLPAQALSSDKEVTTKEVESAMKILWFQNLTGWQNIQKMALKEAEERGVLDKTSSVENAANRAKKAEEKNSWRAKSLFGLNED